MLLCALVAATACAACVEPWGMAICSVDFRPQSSMDEFFGMLGGNISLVIGGFQALQVAVKMGSPKWVD